MSLAIQNAERKVNQLTKTMGVRETRLESVKRLMLDRETTREEFVQLSGIKYDLKREIAELEAHVDMYASVADLHRGYAREIDMAVAAIQEKHGLNGLTKDEVVLQALKEKMGWS